MQKLFNFLICPDCKAGINNFKCSRCGRVFDDESGMMNLLPKEMGEWKEIEARFHDEESDRYDEINCVESPRNRRIHRQFLNWIKTGIKNNPEARILEIGGGTGFDAEKIIGHNNNILFILSDLSKGALEIGEKRLKNKSNVMFCLADAENTPFCDSSLNCVYIIAALHHLECPEKFLKEAERCLAPGGQLIIGIEPNKFGHVMYQRVIFGIWSLLKRKKLDKSDKLASIGDEKTEGFSRSEIKKILVLAGFLDISIKPVWFFTGFYHTFAQKFKWIDSPIFDYILMPFDWIVENIPFLNNFCWHWNIRATKKSIKPQSL